MRKDRGLLSEGIVLRMSGLLRAILIYFCVETDRWMLQGRGSLATFHFTVQKHPGRGWMITCFGGRCCELCSDLQEQ